MAAATKQLKDERRMRASRHKVGCKPAGDTKKKDQVDDAKGLEEQAGNEEEHKQAGNEEEYMQSGDAKEHGKKAGDVKEHEWAGNGMEVEKVGNGAEH